MNWHLFTTAYGLVATPMQGAVNGIIGGLIAYVRPVMFAGVTLWIAAQSLAVANGAAPINSLYRGVLRAAVIISVLQSLGTYQQYVANVAQIIPVEVGNAIAGAGTDITNGAAFDAIANKSLKAGLLTWEHVPAYAIKAAVLAGISIPIYSIFALVFVAAAFMVYLSAAVALGLLISVGPLFVALYIFPSTQRLAHGWIGAVAGAVLTQILSVAILGLMAGSAAITTTPILQNAAGENANFVDELCLLLGNGVLLGIIASIVKHIPGWAATIAGGVNHSVTAFTGRAFGVMSAMGNSTTRMAGQGAAAIGRHASNQIGHSAIHPPVAGRSLSGANP